MHLGINMSAKLQKFSSQADPELLIIIKELAKEEGKQFQTLLDEAMRDLIEKKKRTNPRKHIISCFQECSDIYAPLFEMLAK